jgi:hypothetical protein
MQQNPRVMMVLAAGCLLVFVAGCQITPPISEHGGEHVYGSLNEIFHNVDHYYRVLRRQRDTFRTNIASYDELLLSCRYLQVLCRQASSRYGTVGSRLPSACTAALQIILVIPTRAGGLASDQDHVPGLIDELGERIEQMKQSV